MGKVLEMRDKNLKLQSPSQDPFPETTNFTQSPSRFPRMYSLLLDDQIKLM